MKEKRSESAEKARCVTKGIGENTMEKDGMRKSKILLAVWLCAMLCCGITACGQGSNDAETMSDYQSEEASYGLQKNMTMETADATEETMGAEGEAGDSGAGSVANKTVTPQSEDQKKIIKTYRYQYETERFDEAYAYLKKQIEAYQGYISYSSINGTGYRNLQMEARIPAEASDEFTATLGSLGTVISQSESATDITLQYSDTQSRINSLKTEQERLNKLLEQAESLETIIALEERLTQVRYELETYQSQKNLYDDQVSYSTVNIELDEVSYTVAVDDSTFFSRIASGLESAFRDIGEGFVNFLVVLIIALPYLAVWGIILTIIILIIKKIRKHRRKRKQVVSGTTEGLKEQDDNLKK